MPIEFDQSAQQYRIDGEHFLPPTNLTLEEALSVVMLAKRVGQVERESILAAAVKAADKIAAGLPVAMRERLDEVADSLLIDPGQRNPLTDKREVYKAVFAASVHQRAVRLRYDCRTEFQRIDTELEPYVLFHSERSWYAVGRSTRHNEVRTFNIGRILDVETLDRGFDRPRTFSLKKHFGNAWRMIPEDGPDETVHLRFAPFLAGNVSEVLWHPTQRCEVAEDGYLDYFATVSGLREIVWWVLGYGDQVEVIKPLRLRKMVARRLRSAAERYRGDDA